MNGLFLMTAFIMLMSVFGIVGVEGASAEQISIQALPEILSQMQSALNALQNDVTKIRDQAAPTWSQKLQCNTTACPRFELVLDGAAVLDKETGLVWEKSPFMYGERTWGAAMIICENGVQGGRKGWRLPTVEELSSLVDPSVAIPGPTLPSGHPFTNVQSSAYWSATATDSADWVGYVNFRYGDMGYASKDDSHYVWCVRGAGYDSR
jgi:hypothetical protein